MIHMTTVSDTALLYKFYLFVEIVATKKVVTAWVAEFVLIQDPESFVDFIIGNSSTYLCPPTNEIKFTL